MIGGSFASLRSAHSPIFDGCSPFGVFYTTTLNKPQNLLTNTLAI